MSPSVAPPSPQEVHRKLSVHSAARSTPKPSQVSVSGVSGTESDSDSILTPDVLSLSPSGLAGASGAANPSSQPPLSSIAERRDGSGGEDSEEEEEEEEGGWKSADIAKNLHSGLDEVVLKAGYLWKKGERRKTWKKRWFVLRPAHLAYYKTAAEYQLLRLLELSDVHSCTQVALKRHDNTFGLVSPVRTFYLQAKTGPEVQEWVSAIDDARQALLATSTQNSVSSPIPIPTTQNQSTPFTPPPVTPSPPSYPLLAQNVTSSDSEDASPHQRTQSSSSQQQSIVASPHAKGQPAAKDSGKIVLSGYLMKCGSKRRNWRKRWFVLTGERLVYSASHMDTKPHRQFAFSEILDALEYNLPHRQNPPHVHASSPTVPHMPVDTDEAHGTHTFKIVTTKRTLLLCAPGEDDEIRWLGAIRALIARRSGTGVVPGESARPTTSGAATSVVAAAGPSDVSPPSSGFTSGGSGGIKSKGRRLSASGGPGLSGVIVEEAANPK